MKKIQNAYASLTAVIDQMVADRLDKDTILSLRSMLEMPAFQPIRDVIEKKIIEVGNYLKSKEAPVAPKPIEVWMGQPRKDTLATVVDRLHKNVDDAIKRHTDNQPVTAPVPPDGIELDGNLDCGWAPFEYDERDPDPMRGFFDKTKKDVENQLEFDVVLPTIPDVPPEKKD